MRSDLWSIHLTRCSNRSNIARQLCKVRTTGWNCALTNGLASYKHRLPIGQEPNRNSKIANNFLTPLLKTSPSQSLRSTTMAQWKCATLLLKLYSSIHSKPSWDGRWPIWCQIQNLVRRWSRTEIVSCEEKACT